MRTPLVMAALAAAVVLTNVSLSKANTLYQETFGYYDGNGTLAGQSQYFNYDWDSQVNAAGTIKDIGSNIATTNGAISFGGANGNHASGTGAHPAGSTIGVPAQSSSAGPVFLTSTTANTPANQALALQFGVGYNNVADGTILDYTKEYGVYAPGDALNTVNHAGLTFSWFEGNNDAGGGYSLAVEVGGKWYATTQNFNNQSVAANGSGTAGFKNGAFENNVAYTNAVTWNLLNFNGDYSFTANALGTGTTSTLTSVLSRDTIDPAVTLDTTLDVQAFGLFSDSNTSSSNRRFDAFTITDSAPEPASLALIGIGSVVMLRRRRSI